MDTTSLYHPEVYNQTLVRINKLTLETTPQWGKMDAAQMIAHCVAILDVSNGKPLENTPFVARLFKGMIRKMVVGEKPYPKSSKTHPQYQQSSPKDFEKEKQRLLAAMEKWKGMEGEETKHALFGVLTKEEKGWSSYKHLDHHLSQFGV